MQRARRQMGELKKKKDGLAGTTSRVGIIE